MSESKKDGCHDLPNIYTVYLQVSALVCASHALLRGSARLTSRNCPQWTVSVIGVVSTPSQ
jgi:hypothetical protein